MRTVFLRKDRPLFLASSLFHVEDLLTYPWGNVYYKKQSRRLCFRKNDNRAGNCVSGKLMAWQELYGHDAIAEKFRRASARSRLSGSFLFIGPAGIGKRSFAYALAKSLLCRSNGPDVLDACGSCPSCQMFPGHPDFYYVCKPEEKSFIPLELLIGSKDHRGKEGLCFEISRTPYMGGRKIAVIDDADFLNPEGANAMLKTLEEPPPDSLLILIGTSASKQLPTIRSRCQIVRFAPLSKKHLGRILYESEEVESLEQGLRLAGRSEGNLVSAREMNDESLEAFRETLFQALNPRRPKSFELASQIVEFVESLGKDTQAKRKRLKIVFGMVLQHDRGLLAKTTLDDAPMYDALMRRIDATLEALEQIDRNITPPLIVENWMSR